MWIIDMYFTFLSIDTINVTPFIYNTLIHYSVFELFLYIYLGIWISSCIVGLCFLLVYLALRLAIDGPYIFSEFLISTTDMGKFDIMIVDTLCLNLFTVFSPIILCILLADSAHSVCLLVNPTIFSSTSVTNLEFSVLYVVLKTFIHYLFLLNFILIILDL